MDEIFKLAMLPMGLTFVWASFRLDSAGKEIAETGVIKKWSGLWNTPAQDIFYSEKIRKPYGGYVRFLAGLGIGVGICMSIASLYFWFVLLRGA